MSTIAFPTSKDIYLEADGKKVAVVQSYSSTAFRSEQTIEAFGESEPIAAIANPVNYRIQLSRLYATDDAISDGISFYDLSDFSLVIVKPDKRIVYTGCQWSKIEENGQLSSTVAEHISIVASKRVETNDQTSSSSSEE